MNRAFHLARQIVWKFLQVCAVGTCLEGIKAFTAAVIGGIGSIPGAMIGGVLLGVIEKICLAVPVLAYRPGQAVLPGL